MRVSECPPFDISFTEAPTLILDPLPDQEVELESVPQPIAPLAVPPERLPQSNQCTQ
ncbi:MAG: hypothetical protein IGS48_05250 [Oscillatoriales cyanobacterium C42_A2020_001]|nr:hypothetical protein [Leptolyngbyaceae cyanobacterium C42_A2020_001]